MIKIITYTITILLMVFQVRGSVFAGSKELDSQCATYCYQVVKPLLQYAKSVHSKTEQFTKLQDTIKEQQAAILNLNEIIKYKDSELKLQNELSDSYKSHNHNQQKLILQHENQITKQQAELNLKDNEINDLQSKVKDNDSELAVKTKKLEDKIEFELACSGWTVIQRRMDGSVNFDRTWSEYKEGFGNLRGEFFIGLEKLHLLTQSLPHELYIILQDFKNETRFARYSEFAIGSEDEFYELKTLGEYSGDAGDAMTYHKNTNFSTPDRDHDTHVTNCALDFSSGWWFNNCYMCNLNGQYQYEDSKQRNYIIGWNKWEKGRKLKFTQMKIRPKSF